MRKSLLFRIAADPIARIGSFVNPRLIPADNVEPLPALYLGGGHLVDIPDIEQVINGIAQRIEVQISGVDAETLRLAREDAPSVKNAPCHVGQIWFDDAWQIVEVEWIALLRADMLTTARQSRTRSITLSISTYDTDRSRAPIAFWTDGDQRRRSPTDAFFDNVASINSGTSRRFKTHEK